MNPERIIDKVREAYAGCHSYSDKGRVLPRNWPGKRLLESEFRTTFRRPSDILFEWSDGISRELIWTQQNNAFTMSEARNKETAASLWAAIASVLGISMGSVDNVLPLLLESGSTSVLDLNELIVVGEDSLNYEISGRTERSENISLTIQKDLFVLRRISKEIFLTSKVLTSLKAELRTELYRLREEKKLSQDPFKEFLKHNTNSPTEAITEKTEFTFDQVLINSGVEKDDVFSRDPEFEIHV